MEEYLKPISLIFAIIVAGLTIYKFFKKAPAEIEKETKEEVRKESVATRFVALFESHGVKRSQIPSFFKNGLTFDACEDDAELLKALTPEMIEEAANLFEVNLDWLQGASEKIYEVKDFYKRPDLCETYLEILTEKAKENHLESYVIIPDIKQKKLIESYDAFILITETITTLNDRHIYKYHLLRTRAIDYWKSKAYFAATCALLWKYKCYPIGKVAPYKWLSEIIEGKQLLQYDYEDRQGDVLIPIGGTWHVDEMIEVPNKYLENVCREKDNFGTRAAISMWLELSNYMNIFEDNSHTTTVESYRKKLAELTE
ncbi:hypothetical protein [Pseudoalteromonas spongiae]|uniref:hypothetical protein n=1 Tax=Pseudoalteromonas spongiae TaxID=298657 RepID=UPI00110A63CE|nr:hypothetical protein [Pseudoalteromonas spongiae]TMO82453.1 hypothetical protein CWC15_19625 [Pseudoalteromonas spongiae]